jgi:hypothetical protein
MANFVLMSLGRSSVIVVPPTPTPRSGLPLGKHATTAGRSSPQATASLSLRVKVTANE